MLRILMFTLLAVFGGTSATRSESSTKSEFDFNKPEDVLQYSWKISGFRNCLSGKWSDVLPTEVVKMSTMTADLAPIVKDTLKGSKVWVVGLKGVRICFEGDTCRSDEYLFDFNLFVEPSTGRFLGARGIKVGEAKSLTDAVPNVFSRKDMESRREKFREIPSKPPSTTLLTALQRAVGCTVPVASQVLVSYVIVDSEYDGVYPGWVVTAFNVPPIEFGPPKDPPTRWTNIRCNINDSTGQWVVSGGADVVIPDTIPDSSK